MISVRLSATNSFLLLTPGVTDHLAENEQHALSLARSVVDSLNAPPHPLAAAWAPWLATGGSGSGWEEPRFAPEELRGEA